MVYSSSSRLNLTDVASSTSSTDLRLLFCCEALILKLGHEAHRSDEECRTALLSLGEQLSPGMVDIASHAFASHVLRTYLLVLAGFSDRSSSRKRDDTAQHATIAILKAISSSTALHEPLEALIMKLAPDLDVSAAQSLASSQTASPVIQIMVEFELSQKGATPVLSLLLPDEDLTYAQKMLNDPVGSHLMEIVIAKCPGRLFKRIYKGLLDAKLVDTAKSSTGSYVLIKAIDRFSSGNLEKAVQELAPVMSDLVRNSTAVVTALVEQCRRREVGVKMIREAFGPISIDAEVPVHVSVLYQAMLSANDELRDLVMERVIDLSQEEVIAMSKQNVASRILQAALRPEQPAYFRKQIISPFLGRIPELAQDNIASHLVDALWTGSTGLKFLRDRLINEVLANEQTLRQTIPGRAVCRNWRKWSRESDEEVASMASRGIDRARKRHALASTRGRKKARSDQ